MMSSSIVCEWWVSLGLRVKDRGIQPSSSTQREEWMMTSSSSMCSTQSSLSNQPGHHLLQKCDSGPGQLQIALFTKLRYLGVYVYPCMPNMMFIIQETNRMYGTFKMRYHLNLELLCDDMVRQNKTVLVSQQKQGLLVFGGLDDDTGLKLESAFDIRFSREQCLSSWEKLVLHHSPASASAIRR